MTCRTSAWHKSRGWQVQANSPTRKTIQHRYWHKADGGYIRRRRRTLAQQRAEVLRQLAEVTSD